MAEPPTVADAQIEADCKPPTTFMSLPQELKDDILERTLFSTTVHVERGKVREGFPADSDMEQTNHEMSVLPVVPDEITSLKLVCRTFAQSIGKKWHSRVTYYFPSTVSFIDVLSEWPAERIRSLRFAYVCDTPFTRKSFGFLGQSFFLVPSLFPNLQLEKLVLRNMETLSTEAGPAEHAISIYQGLHARIGMIPFTRGWKTLEYVSRPLGFLPSEQRILEEGVEEIKARRSEPDFQLELLGPIRPKLCASPHPLDANGMGPRDYQVVEIEQWYADHPEERTSEYSFEDNTQRVTVRVRRGRKTVYVEHDAAYDVFRQSLLNNMSWAEIRATNDHIIDDGLHIKPRTPSMN